MVFTKIRVAALFCAGNSLRAHRVLYIIALPVGQTENFVKIHSSQDLKK